MYPPAQLLATSPLEVGLAGGLSGLAFLLVAPAFDGSGGKLGTIAFVSCIGLSGTLELRAAAVERIR